MIATLRHAVVALGLCIASTAHAAGGCAAAAPRDFAGKPAQWLGPCAGGKAQGVGVMRGGSGNRVVFFAGEMRGGAPVKGIMILEDGWRAVTRFDALRRDATPRSTDPNENHALFVLATRAANATAQRFAAQGNRDSAVYYRRLATRIRDGEPE